MVSSRMRSALPFKATPSTCFPPPPPPVYPGFIPCFHLKWGDLASIQLDVLMTHAGQDLPLIASATGINIALVTKGPGDTQWTTTLNTPTLDNVQFGLRCLSFDYTGYHLYSFVRGRFNLPDGSNINAYCYWQPVEQFFITDDGHAKKAQWTIGNAYAFNNGYWYTYEVAGTLTEISAPPRSRPPYPMIPSIG